MECRTEHLNCHQNLYLKKLHFGVQLEYFWSAALAAGKGAGLHPNLLQIWYVAFIIHYMCTTSIHVLYGSCTLSILHSNNIVGCSTVHLRLIICRRCVSRCVSLVLVNRWVSPDEGIWQKLCSFGSR